MDSRQMHVHVDQARNAGISRQVDDFSICGDRRLRRTDTLNAVAFNDDNSVRQYFAGAIHQLSKSNGFRLAKVLLP
ncbi:MAG: hypothetical protein LC775_17515, partial [Acidobacteria bacterium]|nr:hypothetical protein [Acidobacteriota bacterium]